ncbi:MAG: DUF120 domain-containing protein [Candidatus Nanosalina sp.]
MGKIEGKVFSGMEEGSYYLSLDPYKQKIEEAVGFKPFEGTLNLRVDPVELKKLEAQREPEVVKSFEYGMEEYSRLEIYPVTAEGVEAAYLDIAQTDYGADVMELVASGKLRDELGLEDGDTVEVEY